MPLFLSLPVSIPFENILKSLGCLTAGSYPKAPTCNLRQPDRHGLSEPEISYSVSQCSDVVRLALDFSVEAGWSNIGYCK